MASPFESPDNPYQSPAHPSRGIPPGAEQSFPPEGIAAQVPVVAILLMVQGGLEVLVSLMYFLFGGLMPAIMAGMPPPGPAAQPGPPPAAFGWFVAGIYGAMGLVALVAGLLKVVAGWRNYRYRGRALGIIGLASGLASIVTCYCAPTAIALFVYGLIVYLSPQTALAFEQAESRANTNDVSTMGTTPDYTGDRPGEKP